MKRLATAAIGLPVLFVIVRYLDPRYFFALVGVAAIIATWEFHLMAKQRGIHADPVLGAALTLAVIASFVEPRIGLGAALAAAAILVPGRLLVSRAAVQGAFESMSATLAGVLFLGVTFGYVAGLMGSGDEMGRDLTIFLLLVVWIADAGAYGFGSWIGRHPLAPTISPKKTIEGACAGLVASVLAAWVAKLWFFQKLGARDAIALAVLLWIAGLAGDLCESLLKRSASLKDTGALFPGHGGMLDRADSLLFGAPVLFFYYRAFMV
ncbi:MAG: phosphatidate cytidylyltransferase [Acidobacteria bacterium]|nr:phosphatidate cytidylyltransferase [Acidobacteriota bacterium]